jgi:sugar (pentulose or hexulose) kinase
MAFLLGIDAGTSAIKAALFDGDGRETAAASQPTDLVLPAPGHVEADMDRLYEQVCAVIRAACAQAGVSSASVEAVGITANMVGFWPVDASGRPTRRAILWNDARTQPLIDRLEAETPGLLHRIFRQSGSAMQPGCTLPILRWMLEHEPAVLEQTATALCCKDWLRFRLTGERATDPTEASVMPGDTQTRGYSPLAQALLGVEHFADRLPPVLPSEAIVGEVTQRASRETGLRPGTPVVTGAGDVPASALGAGAAEPGSAPIVLGTTCLSGMVLSVPTWQPPDVGLLFCMPGGSWLRMMATIAGTSNLDWILGQTLADAADSGTGGLFVRAQTLAADVPAGSAGVLYLPYLSEAGIIAPVVAPHARAAFLGLSPLHTRGHLLRSVLEGVALATRDCYAAMSTPQPERVFLVGGGANSPLWCQIMADVLGAQVDVPAGTEFGAKGAAMLASVGIGRDSDPAAAARRTTRIARTYRPDAANQQVYDRLYARFAATRQAILALSTG